ncbi:MAG: PilZ domain-containing protein [Spirochaetes bacterium]|nr:PilZ domain-containing protein [Spirochaetota bacterium]
MPVTFRFLASDNLEFFGTCIDVSSNGIQMKTKIPLQEGDRFTFSVPLGGFERISYRACVCWSEQNADAVHVGCRFESAA